MCPFNAALSHMVLNFRLSLLGNRDLLNIVCLSLPAFRFLSSFNISNSNTQQFRKPTSDACDESYLLRSTWLQAKYADFNMLGNSYISSLSINVAVGSKRTVNAKAYSKQKLEMVKQNIQQQLNW